MVSLIVNRVFNKFLIIGLFLISLFVSSTHHHTDFQPHYDCPVCLFQINSNNANVSSDTIIIKAPEDLSLIPKKREDYILFKKINNPSQRAPPFIH